MPPPYHLLSPPSLKKACQHRAESTALGFFELYRALNSPQLAQDQRNGLKLLKATFLTAYQMLFSCAEGKIGSIEKLSLNTAWDSFSDSLCHDVPSVTSLTRKSSGTLHILIYSLAKPSAALHFTLH